MRICCIADAENTLTKAWVNYFVNKGHEVHVISLTSWKGEDYAPGVHNHLATRLVPQIWSVTKYPSHLLWPIQVRRLVRKIKPNVMVSHWVTIKGYLAIASGFHPVVLNAWGSDILIHPKKNPLWRVLTKYTLKKADVVVCCGEVLRDGLLELGTDPGKIRLIYNGVDTQQFNPQRKDDELRNSLGLGKAPTIISTRHLRPLYDVQTLIKAVPLVLSQVSEVKFIISGDGDQRDYLENLARSLGVSESVKFVGWILHDELPNYLASSDIYVSTSLSDGTSASLLEAMACGVAPVVTDIPGNRGWVIEGENGFIIPVKNTRLLAAKIISLLKDRDTRERFGKMGRNIVQERAEFETEMERVEKLYESLAVCL